MNKREIEMAEPLATPTNVTFQGLVSGERTHFYVRGLFLIMLIYALYFARDFFMPVVLGFLFALTLTPIVRWAGKRGVPPGLSATLLVVVSAVMLAISSYLLSGPVGDLVSRAPAIGAEMRERLAEIQGPLQRIIQATEQFDGAADAVRDPEIQRVAVAQPGIISRAAGSVSAFLTTIAITFVLALFVLASGTMFYEKIVQSFGRLSEKKRALRVIYDVEREISRYLLTVTIINVALGAAIALGLWLLGMPTPILWGVLAAALNFLPYVGALTTIVLVGALSLVSFDTLTFALIPPAYVLLCNIIEGQIVTPLVIGRRLELNAVAIFIAVAFWSWMWGFVGALIAVPILVVVKVFCDHFDSLSHIGNFLAAQQTIDRGDDTETAT